MTCEAVLPQTLGRHHLALVDEGYTSLSLLCLQLVAKLMIHYGGCLPLTQGVCSLD